MRGEVPGACGPLAPLATSPFAVLILIESTDVVFAIDSIPATLAVSREPNIVFASNAFAIPGLWAVYLWLAGMAMRLRYLNSGLGVILAFVGLTTLITDVYRVRHRGKPRGYQYGSARSLFRCA